jgi:hypothetical protein
MTWIVTCPECLASIPRMKPSTFDDKPGAEAFVRRHRSILGNHKPTITETP